MEIIKYTDKLGDRSRQPWAFVIGPGDQLELFKGKSIPGKLAVTGYDFTRNGKWSYTTFRLTLAGKVRFLAGHSGWETGTFVEGLYSATGRPTDRWTEVASALGVTLPVAQEFLRAWRPKAAANLDQIEEDLASLDETAEDGACIISFTYGFPTRRQREGGFWDWPVLILDRKGRRVGSINPKGGVTGPVRVLKRIEGLGRGGGFVSILLAVPDGCHAEHTEV